MQKAVFFISLKRLQKLMRAEVCGSSYHNDCEKNIWLRNGTHTAPQCQMGHKSVVMRWLVVAKLQLLLLERSLFVCLEIYIRRTERKANMQLRYKYKA